MLYSPDSSGQQPQPADPPDPPDPGQPALATPAQPVLIPPKMTTFVEAKLAVGVLPDKPSKVVLALEILDTGGVGEVTVLESASPEMDAASVEAAAQLRFEPAQWGGKPVPVKIRFTFRFEPPPPAPKAVPKQEASDDAPREAAPRPVTLVGTVLERGTRRPLLGVRVQLGLDKQAQVVETDENGRFGFAVGAGTHQLGFSETTHEPETSQEVVEEGKRTDVKIYLMPRSKGRFRSVVRTKRPRREVTRFTLEKQELVRVPGTFGEPFRVIEALPGLARAPFTGGFLIVRGANPFDTGVFIDGSEIRLLYHFLAGPAVFNADLVKSIAFYPGNWSVRFGRRMGGLVEVATDDERPDANRGAAELNLFLVSVLDRHPVSDDVDLFGAARHSHLDVVLSTLAAFDLLEPGLAPSYWDYQLGGGMNVDRWRVRLLAYGSKDTFAEYGESEGEAGVDEGEETVAAISFHRMALRATRPLPLRGKLAVQATLGVDLLEVGAGTNSFEIVGWNLEGRADLRLRPFDWLTVDTGLDFIGKRQSVDATTPVPQTPWAFPGPTFDADAPKFVVNTELEQTMPAAYVELEVSPLPWLTLIPGLRVDYFGGESLDDLTVDPRMVVRVQPGWDRLWLKGGYGLFHQPPESFLVADGLGAELQIPFAVHTSVGAEFEITDKLTLDTTLYDLDRHSIISISRQTQATDEGVTTERFDNDRQERSQGIETLVKYQPGGDFFGWISYTLAKTERRESADATWELHPLDQTHILTLVASYELPYDIVLGTRIRFVTGNPQTPITGATVDIDRDRYDPVRGAPRSTRNPPYFQADLRIDRKWTFDLWWLTAYLDVLNVTNYDNVESPTYQYDYRAEGAVSGVPLFPNFGVKGEW